MLLKCGFKSEDDTIGTMIVMVEFEQKGEHESFATAGEPTEKLTWFASSQMVVRKRFSSTVKG